MSCPRNSLASGDGESSTASCAAEDAETPHRVDDLGTFGTQQAGIASTRPVKHTAPILAGGVVCFAGRLPFSDCG